MRWFFKMLWAHFSLRQFKRNCESAWNYTPPPPKPSKWVTRDEAHNIAAREANRAVAQVLLNVRKSAQASQPHGNRRQRRLKHWGQMG